MGYRRVSLSLICCLFIFGVFTNVFGDETTANVDASFKEGSKTSTDSVETEARTILLDGLSVEEMKLMRAAAKKHSFDTEVDRMMKLIINSLYKNKEIFLRELISNASDALDKIRFLSVTDKSVMGGNDELSIRIKANKDARTLHITDTGVGMTKDELITNLGTIAKSGTSEFLSKFGKADTNENNDLIGQFGVGFYSSFLIADMVSVISKNNDDSQYIWESDASSFAINKDPRGDTLKRGTEIILHLKDEAEDYLDHISLQNLVKKYSQFINFPIYVWGSHTETMEEPVESSETENKDVKANEDVQVEEDKKPDTKKVEKTVWDWVLVNENKPVWTRKPQDVMEEEYNSFYKSFTKDVEDPLGKIHFSAEGEVSFKSILYIPARAGSDLYSRAQDSVKDNIKLYVRRVFITDNFEELMPKYFGFIRGVVDSDDLPLNVSRENLQQSKLLKIIKKKLIRKAIEMISKLSAQAYETFWKEFGVSVKLGAIEDSANRGRMTKLLRFRTSRNESAYSSLEEYVARMPVDQKSIYYMAATNVLEAKRSPFVERLLKKNFEVIYMVDPIDEYLSQNINEFEGKKLQNVAREGVDFEESDKTKEDKEARAKAFEPLLKWLKEDVLADKIEKAVLSDVLDDSPCALVASAYGWSGNMERIMRAQAFQKAADMQSEFYTTQKKIFDINPRHPIIKELLKRISENPEDERAKETAKLLFDLAALRSGYTISDSVGFASLIETVMRKNLDVDLNEKVDAEPEDDLTAANSPDEVPADDFNIDTDEPVEMNSGSESAKKDEL